MRSGYQINWTEHALNELAQTIQYLEENFTDRELTLLANSLDKTLLLISKNPKLFSHSISKSEIRKVIVRKYNTLYYRIKDESSIEILSFFSNRQNPEKRKI